MSQTLTEKVLGRGLTGRTLDGSEWREVEPDLLLGHDATIALVVDRFADADKPLAFPERLFLVADHFAPPSTVDRANVLRRFLDFVERHGIGGPAGGTFQMMQGICHQVLVESPRCVPGSIVVGADSHTTMAGALGAFATGMGSTDILAVLQTGTTWLRIPPSDRIVLEGSMAPHLRGKDLALWMMRTYGEGGAGWKALEFEDCTDGDPIPMDSRLTLTNMSVDCGAVNGIWVPDDLTRRYFESNGGVWPTDADLSPDPGATYAAEHRLDVTSLAPQIAAPYSPANVSDVGAVAGERVHQVFIGSCAGGRIEEIADAASILRGRRIDSRLKLVVTPASQAVYRAAMEDGSLTALIDAGAVITNPSCGACGGIDKGLLAAGEVCVSTSNRNFRGRMGDVDARVFLGSGLTAAASALTGRITDPREVMQ